MFRFILIVLLDGIREQAAYVIASRMKICWVTGVHS